MKYLIATLVLSFAAFGSEATSAEFSETELVSLGQSYAQTINDLDADALTDLIAIQHLAGNIAEIVGDSDAEKQQFLRAFTDAIPTINERMLAELERQGARAIFLRIHEFDGMRGPLVRFSVGAGYNYVLLLPVRSAPSSKDAAIGDLYFATAGERLSETIGVATKLASSPSKTFLGKLFGVDEVDRDIVTRFQQVTKFRQQNRLREAYDVFDGMQASTRNHRLILMNTIQIASQLDDGLYRQELRRLAEHHKDDPRAAFTLLDHYFFENDFDSAMAIIDVMEKSYGSDAVMFMFRANVESARSRPDSAIRFAETAIQMEPGNEDAQWTLLTMLVDTGNYADSVTVLRTLESEFGYTFVREDFQDQPLYTEFVKSDEFAQWIDAT